VNSVAGTSRWSRFWSWCRRHPKTSGVAVAIIVVLAIIGGCTDDSSSSKDAGTSAAGSTTAIASSAASPTTAAAPTVAVPSTPHTAPAPVRSRTPTTRPARNAALAVLATLPVKGRAPKTGYSREQFGPAWTDDNDNPLGHNGCDTRNDILRRDLVAISLKPGSNGCVVLTGILHDPYTARTIRFIRGVSTSADVQIDHVVALSNAWQTGAQRYTLATRTDFANDPLNLLAVDGPTNEAKGDGDAATWLPPNKAFRCAYVARQVVVKARYRLWVTPAEHDAIARILATCPNQPVPTEAGTVSITRQPKTAAAPPPPASTYYQNCAAVRAAGKAPLLRGQPGYSPRLDRDGDGIACER
jgi:hypothetical protein